MNETSPGRTACSYCTFSASWAARSGVELQSVLRHSCYGHIRDMITELTTTPGERVQVWAFRPRPKWNGRKGGTS